MSEFDLDRLFRRNSKARKVAEMLLDGMEHSRPDLADAAKVSATTVPRVISALEGEGIEFERHHRGNRVTYQRVDGIPRNEVPDLPTEIKKRLVGRFIATADPAMTVNVQNIGHREGGLFVAFDSPPLGEALAGSVVPENDGGIPGGLLGAPARVLELMVLDDGEYLVRIGSEQGSVLVALDRESIPV